MNCNSVIYSRHAIERMFQRAIAPEEVVAVLQSGETIASYPEDTPIPVCCWGRRRISRYISSWLATRRRTDVTWSPYTARTLSFGGRTTKRGGRHEVCSLQDRRNATGNCDRYASVLSLK